jgi:hypothetical protein
VHDESRFTRLSLVRPVPLFFDGDDAYAFVRRSRPSVTAQSLAVAVDLDRETDMKFALVAWIQFIVGLVILGAADYWIRWRGGWLGNPGTPTPDAIWFGVPSLLGLVAMSLLWRSTGRMNRWWLRVIVVVSQAAIGFILYLAACLWYVIGTGVDSL